MDGTLNDFFNEIDQIAPPNPKEVKNDSVWQECYDNSSGYTYYWNVKTDQVTWEIPEEYKLWKEKNSSQKSGNLYVPPKSAPLFPSTTLSKTKIYKIQEDSQAVGVVDDTKKIEHAEKRKVVESKHGRKLQGSNDKEEKIVLISSYGDGSESESEPEKQTRTVSIIKEEPVILGPRVPDRINSHSSSRSNSDNEEEDIDLLTQIQNRAKVLKDLGGELPPDVRKLVEENGSEKKELPQKQKKEKKDVTGFSLVAGYGDDSEEEEETIVAFVPPPPPPENKTSHSTLFPIAKPIDIRQFNEVKKEPEASDLNSIDPKAFHRKRRIGIDFKPSKPEPYLNNKLDGVEVARQGLGFKKEKETESVVPKTDTRSNYPGFKSGGVMFVKSDVLNPSAELDKKEGIVKDDEPENDSVIKIKIEETHKTLNEKLTFLSEGREPASPVQVIIIQMETLYEAMKEGSLTIKYLHKWLKETCSELVKLEKDAAPSGWLLQWDRINKRYYYRNQQTGDSQWEYPQPDIVGGDDAMDISTTPPPPPIHDEPPEPVPSTPVPIEPPPPPRIKSPTPPPPPTISKPSKHKSKGSGKAHSNSNPPLPPEVLPQLPPLPAEKFNPHGEPLPPGVDSPYGSPPPPPPIEETESNTNDVLGSALNSFYSDLAAMETEAKSPKAAATAEIPQPTNDTSYVNVTTTEGPPKKKKKTKVKLVQGLAMKKKGVSKLVERWKNVQKDYNN